MPHQDPHQERSDAQPAWDEFIARYGVGDVITGEVTKVVPFGAFVEVAQGVVGLLVESGRPDLGTRVRARISGIDPERHRMSLIAV